MSRVQGVNTNPNAKFRTYSYHHILAVCDTTATAEALSNSSSEPSFFGPGSTSDNLVAREIGGGTYFILINGMTDAHYVIRHVDWEAMYASIVKDSDNNAVNPNVIGEFGGEMIIEEPAGIDFLNTMSKICLELKANPNSQVFLLKTIFVGHSDASGNELPVIDASLVPMLLKPWDIEADIKSTGVTYTFKFLSMVNGSGGAKHYDNVEMKGGFKFPKQSSLAETFLKYQQDLNAQLDRERKEVLKKASEAGGDLEKAKLDAGKPVEYVFEVDETFKDLRSGTNTKPQDQVTGAFDPTLDFTGKGMRGSLAEIMQASEDVVRRVTGNQADKDTKQQGFKVDVQEIIEKEKVVIKYKIVPYEIATDPPASTGGRFTPPAEDVLEFNYIFTGLNTDIKDLDLKIALGQQLYQIFAISSGRSSQQEYAKNQNVNTNASTNQGQNPGSQSNTLLQNSVAPMPGRTGTNHGSGAETMDYFATLRRFISLSNINVKMTIVGNPLLLSESSVSPAKNDAMFNASADTRTSVGYSKNPMKVPTYVKLNIKYPAKNADYTNLQLLYDGHYRILTIKNIFDDGEFTQELDLISVSEKDPSTEAARTAQKREEKNLAQQRGQFAGGSISTSRAAPGKFKPQKGPDGKYNFSPEVNEAIAKASKKHGVDEAFMRNMCYIESKGDPNAVSPTGAKGLFQFVGGTADQYGIRGQEFDIDANADAAARFAKDNQRSLENAGVDPTPENLYVAHQQGAGGANTLHRAASQGLEYDQLKPGLRENMRLNNSSGLSAQGYINKWHNKYAEVDSKVSDAGTPSTATETQVTQSTEKTKQSQNTSQATSNVATKMTVKDKLAKASVNNLGQLAGE